MAKHPASRIDEIDWPKIRSIACVIRDVDRAVLANPYAVDIWDHEIHDASVLSLRICGDIVRDAFTMVGAGHEDRRCDIIHIHGETHIRFPALELVIRVCGFHCSDDNVGGHVGVEAHCIDSEWAQMTRHEYAEAWTLSRVDECEMWTPDEKGNDVVWRLMSAEEAKPEEDPEVRHAKRPPVIVGSMLLHRDATARIWTTCDRFTVVP